MANSTTPALTAPHHLSYTYKRSLGNVLSQFFTALRDRRLLGVRRADGRVLFPAREYDPDTSETLSELVEVGQTGVVKTWVWVAKPRRQQPLSQPFAYALVQLDGADTPFLHVVDTGSESRMATGLRVRARWMEETKGVISDFVFVPA